MKYLILVLALFAAITFWIGGCQTATTPEKLPLTLEPMTYGTQAEAGAVWPVWSVQVAWRATNSPDTYGPVTHLIQLKNKPTLADVQKFIPAPDYLPGKYKPLKVFNIVQIGPEKPVEIPEKK